MKGTIHHGPDLLFILEKNAESPGIIKNHLNFYSFEAAMEITRFELKKSLAVKAINNYDFSGTVKLTYESHEARASAMLLIDKDLIKQIKKESQNSKNLLVLAGLEQKNYMKEHFENTL